MCGKKFQNLTEQVLNRNGLRGIRDNLRVLHWTPKNEDYKQARTLVMIPGWNSVPEDAFPILSEWVRQRPVVYIETREKGSCRIDTKISKESFQIRNIASDLPIIFGKDGA